MLDQIGDVGAALQRADPAKLEELYRSLGLEMTTARQNDWSR